MPNVYSEQLVDYIERRLLHDTMLNDDSYRTGWNRLPAKVVSAETVNGFKNAYDHNYDKDMDARSR